MKIWVLSWEENGWHFTDTSGSTQSLCTHDGSKTKWSDASRRKDVPVNKLPNADSCVIVYFATRRSTTKVNFQRCQTFSQLQNWGEKTPTSNSNKKKFAYNYGTQWHTKQSGGKKKNLKISINQNHFPRLFIFRWHFWNTKCFWMACTVPPYWEVKMSLEVCHMAFGYPPQDNLDAWKFWNILILFPHRELRGWYFSELLNMKGTIKI